MANTTIKWTTEAITDNHRLCYYNQSYNPYYGVFGTAEIIDVIYLSVVVLLGTFGNLLVIASVIYKKKVFQSGNAFMINLAAADFLVCSFSVPTVIANVITTENASSEGFCEFTAYVLDITCNTSIGNLVFIAFCRYWYIVRHKSYRRVFSKRNTILMVIFIWIWANFMIAPSTFKIWSKPIYDSKLALCTFDDCASLAYNIVLMVLAFGVPDVIIVICYFRLFVYVKQHNKTMKRHTVNSLYSVRVNQKNVRMAREINLLKTLAVTIVIFLLCWTPYAIIVLGFVNTVPPHVKKAAGQLGLSNSAMNFIVYGAMNPVYRKGYKDFLRHLFCCDRAAQSATTMDRSSTNNYQPPRVPNNFNSNLSTIKEKE